MAPKEWGWGTPILQPRFSTVQKQTKSDSILREQPNPRASRNLHCATNWFAILAEMNAAPLRRRNRDGSGAPCCCRVIQNEIELARGEQVRIKRIKQIEIHQQEFSVANLPQGLI